jgi:hypothetical protein
MLAVDHDIKTTAAFQVLSELMKVLENREIPDTEDPGTYGLYAAFETACRHLEEAKDRSFPNSPDFAIRMTSLRQRVMETLGFLKLRGESPWLIVDGAKEDLLAISVALQHPPRWERW